MGRLLIFIVAVVLGRGLCGRGVDYSTLFSKDQCECLLEAGYSYVIPRGFQSTGRLDSNIKANLKNAKEGGINSVDLYMFPCVPCGNPEGQVDQIIDGLQGSTYDKIWVDVEKYRWSTSQNANREFLTKIIKRLEQRGAKIGIYSNFNMWTALLGSTWDCCSQYPLWYAHYDYDPSFKSFKPFGGWKSPVMKQFKGSTTLCRGTVDINSF